MSQEPSHMPVEGNWYPQPCLNLVFVPSVQVGHRGPLIPVLFVSNFGRPYLSRPNSVWGVLRLYGKPIESRFFTCACGRKWVSTTMLKIYVLVQVIWLCRCE